MYINLYKAFVFGALNDGVVERTFEQFRHSRNNIYSHVAGYAGLWNGVIARATPWMASANALDAQPTALEDTVFQYSFHHVLRTGGSIAAGGGRKGRDASSVEIYGEQCRLPKENRERCFVGVHSCNCFSIFCTAFCMAAVMSACERCSLSI